MILLFQGARQVIKADLKLRQQGFHTTIIPVPEHYSTECGMCIRFESSEQQSVVQALTNEKIEYRIVDESK